MNIQDLLSRGANMVRSYLDTNIAQPVEKTIISPLKATAQKANNYIDQAWAKSYTETFQGIIGPATFRLH